MLRARRSWTAVSLACLLGLSAAVPVVRASIDLEWRPLTQTVNLGDPFGIGLYAVSDSGGPEGFSAAQVIMEWDPEYLQLTGNSTAGAIDLMGSSFLPGDSFGINEANPPADGDAMWVGMVTFGQERQATPEGVLLTTITFNALALTEPGGSLVTLLPDNSGHPHPPYPLGYTKMLNLAGESVLGTLGPSAVVHVIPEPGGWVVLFSVMLAFRRR